MVIGKMVGSLTVFIADVADDCCHVIEVSDDSENSIGHVHQSAGSARQRNAATQYQGSRHEE
jgi:hypothetical protein